MSEGYRGRHSRPESSGEDGSTALADVEREAERAMLPTGLEDEGWIDVAVGMILLLALLVIARSCASARTSVGHVCRMASEPR